jgi:hypothetical protein
LCLLLSQGVGKRSPQKAQHSCEKTLTLGPTKLVQGCDKLPVKLWRPCAPGLPRLLLLLGCLLWLRLEAQRRGRRLQGDSPRRCLRADDLAASVLSGTGGSLDRRRRQQGQIQHPSVRGLVSHSQAQRRERRCARDHGLERHEGAATAGLGLRRAPPLVFLLLRS